MTFGLFITLWWLSGFVSLIYIKSKLESEITLGDLIFCTLFSFMGGPMVLVLGLVVWLIAGYPSEIVLWRKK